MGVETVLATLPKVNRGVRCPSTAVTGVVGFGVVAESNGVAEGTVGVASLAGVVETAGAPIGVTTLATGVATAFIGVLIVSTFGVAVAAATTAVKVNRLGVVGWSTEVDD